MLSRTFKTSTTTTIRGYATTSSPSLYSTTIPQLGVSPSARVVVTGFTGKASSFHSEVALKFGTNIVGGVSPKKGGTIHLGKPVYATLEQAVKELQPEVVSVFVPPLLAADAIIEAVDLEVPLIVSVAEGIPAHDQMRVHQKLQSQGKSRLVGANCPGLINTRGCKLGIQPLHIHTPGSIGIAGRSGTLTYEAAFSTSSVGLGQTYVFGLGGDLYPGTTTVEALQFLLGDEDTKGIILLGEIGGSMEQAVSSYLSTLPSSSRNRKPIVGLVAGAAAPRNRTLGHAGAMWELEEETAEFKKKLWREAGIEVVGTPGEVGAVMKSMLS
ncbi:succinyl-CoA-ligase [Meredithblackwellia eburnea MCA 4105]